MGNLINLEPSAKLSHSETNNDEFEEMRDHYNDDSNGSSIASSPSISSTVSAKQQTNSGMLYKVFFQLQLSI